MEYYTIFWKKGNITDRSSHVFTLQKAERLLKTANRFFTAADHWIEKIHAPNISPVYREVGMIPILQDDIWIETVVN